MEALQRKPYPSDVSDEEWHFVLPYLTLMRPDAAGAMEDDDLLWAGFTIILSGSLPEDAGVCVLSRSTKGDYRLGNSDDKLCPA